MSDSTSSKCTAQNLGSMLPQVRDAFALAKEKAPAIIFIDEIDAIGTKRFDSELSGDREVQRTMLELLNQLDGFGSEESIKVNFGDSQQPRQTLSLNPEKVEAGRCSAPCWSCSTSSTASAARRASRCDRTS